MDGTGALDVLTRGYQEYIAGFGLEQALAKELALEDDYEQHVQAVLAASGHEDLADRYTGVDAFCGGGQAAQLVLRGLSTAMHEAHVQVPDPVWTLYAPPGAFEKPRPARMFCGLVPEGDLGVRTLSDPRGTVLFDVGLWFFVRLAVQAIASQLTAATGDGRWGSDDDSGELLVRLRDRLDGYLLRGEGLRDDTFIRVLTGPREAFRRALNRTCVAWILGHEYGHLALTREGPAPDTATWSERAELSSQDVEFRADRIADALVSSSRLMVDPLASVIAPVVVHTLQAYILRSRHRAGDHGPYWTHMVPEMRAGMSLEALATTGPLLADARDVTALHGTGRHFLDWLWASLGTAQSFSDDLPEGISR